MKKKKIIINSKLANLWGLLEEGKKYPTSTEFDIESVAKKKDGFEIKYSYSDLNRKTHNKVLNANKQKIPPLAAAVVAFIIDSVYDDFFDKPKKFDLGKEVLDLLRIAIMKDESSEFIPFCDCREEYCLPYYVLSKSPLRAEKAPFEWDKKLLLDRMLSVMEAVDVFPNFYIKMADLEHNTLKKVAILKRGFEKFPNSIEVLFTLTKVKFEFGDINDSKTLLYDFKGELDQESYDLLVEIHLALKEYNEAQKILERSKKKGLVEDMKYFFKAGVIAYYKKQYKKAIEHLTKAIEHDLEKDYFFDWNFHEIATFIIGSLHELGEYDKMSIVINDLTEDKNEDAYIRNAIKCLPVLEKVLKKCSIDDSYKLKKVLCHMYYEVYIRKSTPVVSNVISRKLSKEESAKIRKALSYAESIKDYFSPFNKKIYEWGAYFLLALKKQEEAFRYALVAESSILGEHILLENCKNYFRDNFFEEVESLGENANLLYLFATNDYLLNYFWKRKDYTAIIKIFKMVSDQHKTSTLLKEFDRNLFEIAYSMKECGELEKAKELYEEYLKRVGASSSVFNNLAMIYKDKGELEKAKELIKKAKKLADDDDKIVNNNYKELVGGGEENEGEKESKQQTDYLAVTFNEENGDVFIGGKKAGNLKPSTPHYVFFHLLFQKANSPVSHDEIKEVIKKKCDTQSHISLTAQQIANKLKSDLKNKIKGVEQIIAPTKTLNKENAYILSRKIVENS